MEFALAAQAAALKDVSLCSEAMARLPEAVRPACDAPTLASRLEVERVRSSFILKVGLADADPARAVAVLNEIVAVYLKRAEKPTSFSVRILENAKPR